MDIETRLNEALPGKVLLPHTEQYEASNNEYFTLFESDLKPAFIVQPTSASDVSSVLKTIGPLWEEQRVPVAVRGTGHTPFAGSANIADGITIDTRGLKGITLNEDKSVVDIGVGQNWASVYTELESHGLTTGGGRVGRVGVSGFVLGGGLSFYSTRTGFTCDLVLEFEVVLASGEIVRANFKENRALWVALKGGLNNFGIVTSFKMRTWESVNMWGGIAFYEPDGFNQLSQTMVKFVTDEIDEDTHIMSSAGIEDGRRILTLCLYHTKGEEKSPSLQPFLLLPDRIEPFHTLRTGTHQSFCDELSQYSHDRVRSYYSGISIKADAKLMSDAHRKWMEVLESLKDTDGFSFFIRFFPMTKAMLTNSRKAGSNAGDIDPNDGPLFIMMFCPSWGSAADDDRIHTAIDKLLAESRVMAADRGLLHRYVFPNYAHYNEDLFKGYGEKSLKALMETSKKYDPKGFFQKAVPGGFKLDGASAGNGDVARTDSARLISHT